MTLGFSAAVVLFCHLSLVAISHNYQFIRMVTVDGKVNTIDGNDMIRLIALTNGELFVLMFDFCIMRRHANKVNGMCEMPDGYAYGYIHCDKG